MIQDAGRDCYRWVGMPWAVVRDCYRWDGTMGCWQELLEVGWYHGLLAGTVRGGMVPWAAGRNC